MGVQVLLRRTGGRPSAQALGGSQKWCYRTGNHPLGEAHGHPHRRAANILEVTVNGFRLLREGGNQVVLVAIRVAADAQVEPGGDEPVVGVGHAVPLQLTAGEIVEVGAALASGRDLSDVVHAHIPGGAIAPEGVSQAARFRVPLQDKNSLAGCACQQTSSRQASDSRTDQDDVVGHGVPLT